MEASVDPSIRGSRLNADHPEKGVLFARQFTGEPKNVVNAVIHAPRHYLLAAVMAIAAEDDVGLGPVPANASNQAAEKLAHLRTRRGLAGTQDHHNRPASVRSVDVNRQKAALIVMGVPSHQRLVALYNVDCIVDVQHHRLGRLPVAPAPDDFPRRWRILRMRDGRLRARSLPVSGMQQSPDR